MKKWQEIFNLSIFGYGFKLEYFNLTSSIDNSDGTLSKYDFKFYKMTKYTNANFILGWNYLKGLKFTIKANK